MSASSEMRSGQTSDKKMRRPLNANERELMEFLLSAEFPGRDDLVSQMNSMMVTRECECGCGTVNFAVGGPVNQAVCREPIPAEARGDGVDVLLFVRKGLLSSLEIVYHSTARPLPYPKPDDLKVWVPQGNR